MQKNAALTLKFLLVSKYVKQIKELSNLISSYFNEINLFIENEISILNFSKLLSFDYIFMDYYAFIDLKRKSNLSIEPFFEKIILISEDEKHAYLAFENGFVDFLHYPILKDKFLQSIQRLKTKYSNKVNISNKIVIKHNKQIKHIEFFKIIYIEAFGNYIKIYTINETITSLEKISFIEHRLPNSFIRIHKSFIINPIFISCFSKLDIILNEKIKLPIGCTYKQLIFNQLQKIS